MQCLGKLFQALKFIWNLSEIYQQDLSKVIVLKRSTQVVMSSALYIAYYQQKVSKNTLLW